MAATPLSGEEAAAPVEHVNTVRTPVVAAMVVAPVVDPQASAKGLRVEVSTAIKARLVDCAAPAVDKRVKAVEMVTVLVRVMNPPPRPKEPMPLIAVFDMVETVAAVTVEEPTVRAEEASPLMDPAVEEKDVVVIVVETVIEITVPADIMNTLVTVTVVV